MLLSARLADQRYNPQLPSHRFAFGASSGQGIEPQVGVFQRALFRWREGLKSNSLYALGEDFRAKDPLLNYAPEQKFQYAGRDWA